MDDVLPCPMDQDGNIINEWKCPKVGCAMGDWLDDYRCLNVQNPAAAYIPCCCSYGANRWVYKNTVPRKIQTNFDIPNTDTSGVSFAFQQLSLDFVLH